MENKTKKQGVAPAVKKLFSLLLALVMLIGATMCVNFSAFAAGWADQAVNVEYNTVYTAEPSKEDAGEHINDMGVTIDRYFDSFKFVVPVKGKVILNMEAASKYYLPLDWESRIEYYIYNANNLDKKYNVDYKINNAGFSTARGVYHGEYEWTLPAGTYYLLFEYDYNSFWGFDQEGSCDFSLSYKPSIANPSNLKATTGTSSVKLTWNKSAGASGYQLQQYKNSQWTTIKNTTATSYSISSLKSYTTYKFRLRAYVKVDGKNYYGSWVSISALTRLATPQTKIAANSNGGFKISWNKIAGADKYQIYYDNGSGYKHFKTVTGTSLTLGTTTYGKKYSFKVRALKSSNSAITSAFSNAVTGTNTKKLQTPSGVKLKKNKNGSFTISWGKVKGANKYQVYLYDTKTKKYKLYKTTTSASVTTGKATKGKTYQYKVRAVRNNNSKATSAFSSVVKGKR